MMTPKRKGNKVQFIRFDQPSKLPRGYPIPSCLSLLEAQSLLEQLAAVIKDMEKDRMFSEEQVEAILDLDCVQGSVRTDLSTALRCMTKDTK